MVKSLEQLIISDHKEAYSISQVRERIRPLAEVIHCAEERICGSDGPANVDQISGKFPFALIGTKSLFPRRKEIFLTQRTTILPVDRPCTDRRVLNAHERRGFSRPNKATNFNKHPKMPLKRAVRDNQVRLPSIFSTRHPVFDECGKIINFKDASTGN
ncbi:hypothetical protein LguiB_028045 [Lonicera macranthoides]